MYSQFVSSLNTDLISYYDLVNDCSNSSDTGTQYDLIALGSVSFVNTTTQYSQTSQLSSTLASNGDAGNNNITDLNNLNVNSINVSTTNGISFSQTNYLQEIQQVLIASI